MSHSLDYDKYGGNVNQSKSKSYGQLSDHKFGTTAQGSGNKKKKYIIGGGILIALIVAVIVVVVVATGGKKDGDPVDPKPKPDPPSPPARYQENPYNVESINRKDNEISGLLKFEPKKRNVKSA